MLLGVYVFARVSLNEWPYIVNARNIITLVASHNEGIFTTLGEAYLA